jgi:tRNA(His) 5'-end guanylyltransferase
MNDDLGDRMKAYESRGKYNLFTTIPVIARLDGKAFHTFTKGLERPYDKGLSDLMVSVTHAMVQYTNANVGYTQSDEITLIWKSPDYKSDIFFGGRHEKMVSILAAACTAEFNNKLSTFLPKKNGGQLQLFDCRVWNVPDETEATNCLIWREQDATRNSISMAAQSVYSHNALMNKSCGDMQEMLFKMGINWNDYPDFFKRGTYIQRSTIERAFSKEELDKLPPKHEARSNPDLKIVRQVIGALQMPQLTKVINRNDVVFRGATPQVKQ